MKKNPERTDVKDSVVFFFGNISSIIIWIMLIILWIIVSGCSTTTTGTYSKQSPINNRKINVYYKGKHKGKKIGHSQKSPIDPRVTVYYNRHGKIKATSKPSPIDPRKRIYRKKE